MSNRMISRKFISPPIKGSKSSENDTGDEGKDSDTGLSGNIKSKERLSRSMSDSQYDDLFSSVLGHTKVDGERKRVNTHHRAKENNEEDEVAIPEPNAALSPAESAEEGPCESTGTAVKTPDQRIDNSVLPPIKRKKPSSKIASLKLKIRPTKLNFDDPALQGESNNLPQSKKPKSLFSKTFPKPKTTSKPSDCNDQQKPYKLDPKKKNCPKTHVRRVSPPTEFRTPVGRAIDDSQLSIGNIACGANLQTPNSSQISCSQTSSVQMQVLSPRSRLFRLHRKRNVGLWVQCTNNECTKWRYLPSTRDPTEVPDNWQCYMNHDKKYASCSVPEKGPTPMEEEDLIHNLYTAGSVVCGHLAGYPWWPAMVDDDPDVEQYYWVTDTCDIPTHYNVTFFDDKPVTRAWLTPSAITKYSLPVRTMDVFKTSARGTEYKRRIEVAKNQAEQALKLTVEERLKKFSFPARYKGPIGKKRYPSDSEDDEVKKSTKRGKVPRKDKTVSAESPLIDIMESLEVVKEVNEVLDELMSEAESIYDGKSGKGTLRAKSSGTVKSKKESQQHKSVAKEDTKKALLKKKGKKLESEVKEDDKDGGKDKHVVTGILGLKKKKHEKVRSEERSNEISAQNDEVSRGKKKDTEASKEMNEDKKVKKDKKNGVSSKHMNKDKEMKRDEKKSEDSQKEKLKVKAVVKAKSMLKHTKADQKDGESTVTHHAKSFKESCSDEKIEKEYSKPSSRSVANKDKNKKKTHGKVQRERSSSGARKDKNRVDVPSLEDHPSCAEQDQSADEKESVAMEKKDGSDISDEEDFPNVSDEESKTEASDSENEDGTSTSEGETVDCHQTQISDSDESVEDTHALQFPVLGASCGRSSVDLFGPQQCDPVLTDSQHSADFEVEE